MLRWTKWVTPVAGLVLMVGLQQSHAQDATTMPEGKATITVTVVDDAGKPVSGATVALLPAPTKAAKGATTQPDAGAARTRPTPLQTAASPTGDDGTATLTKVPDGSYLVSARLKGKGNGREKVIIADGKDETVSVTLKARPAK